MNQIYLHRSYITSNEELFRKAWEYGFQGVETNAPGLNPADDISQVADELARLKEEWFVQGIALHFPMNLITDDKWPDRNATFDRMGKAFKTASEKLDVKVFNTMAAGALIPAGNAYTNYAKNGSAAANETHWARAVEMLKTACDLAAEYHITLALETHGCLIHDLPEPTLKLLSLVAKPNLKINLDLPNMVLSRDNLIPPAELEPLLPLTGHVHLKNLRMVIGGGYLLEGVGGGIIDYKPLFQRLQAVGYKGKYSLEFPGRYGDMDKAVKTDIEFVKKIQLEALGNL